MMASDLLDRLAGVDRPTVCTAIEVAQDRRGDSGRSPGMV
jgi:hypothetical protein